MEVVQRPSQEWMEFNVENPKQQKRHTRTVRVERKEAWNAPEVGVIKLNVCSENFDSGISARVGIVARN